MKIKVEKRMIFKEVKGFGDGKQDYLLSFSVVSRLFKREVMLLFDNYMFQEII